MMRKFLTLVIAAFLPAFIYANNGVESDSVGVAKNRDNALFLDAIRAYNNAEYEQANELFRKVVEANKNNDAAYYYLAKLAAASGDAIAGEYLIKRAIVLDSSNYWYHHLHAGFQMAAKDVKGAIKTYEYLTTHFPPKSEIYYALANLYRSTNEVEKALETLDKIEAIMGKNETIAMTKANAYLAIEAWNTALEYLIDVDQELQSPMVESCIAELYAQMYNDTLAIHYYNKALENDPNFDYALYQLAEFYKTNGEYDKYFEHITEFLTKPYLNTEKISEYLITLFSTPDFISRNKERLDTLMMQCANLHPADTTITFLGAYYFSTTGSNDLGVELLKKNYELTPDNYRVAAMYLEYLYRADKWDMAKDRCIEMMQTYGQDPFLTQLMAFCYYNMEEYLPAIEYFELYIKRLKELGHEPGEYINTYSMIGDILYSKIGNKNEAFKYYEKALRIDNQHLPTLNNYAYFLALENTKLKKALEMSKITIEKEPNNATYIDTYAWILYMNGRYLEAKAMLKHAMLYGGTDNGDILDHYAEVLYALREYDLAFIYWEQAKSKGLGEEITQKIAERKAAMQNGN